MKRQKIRKFVKSHSEAIYAWGTMFPGLAILFIFVFFPIIFSIPLSLTDYSVVGEINFVGFENFKRAFNAISAFKLTTSGALLLAIAVSNFS